VHPVTDSADGVKDNQMSSTKKDIAGCLGVDVGKLRFIGGLLITIVRHKFNKRVGIADRGQK
jgi:hypothetical protein